MDSFLQFLLALAIIIVAAKGAGYLSTRTGQPAVLGLQLVQALEEILQPKGVGVVVEAKHLCMMMRGVEKQNSFAITSSLRGEFERASKTRAEFMGLIGQRKDPYA